MKHLNLTLCACIAALFAVSCSQAPSYVKQDPVDYVNTLVGTGSTHAFSTGNTYPAVGLPWGMNFWTPQNGDMGSGWVYSYDRLRLRGIKHTHQASPWMGDYGQFTLMPVTTGPVFKERERESWINHKAEVAKPYYYSIYLADHDVIAEIAPTSRASVMRLTYPEKETSYFVVDAYDKGSYVKIIPAENKIVGYSTRNSGGVPEGFKDYFVLVSDTPFEVCKTVKDDELTDALESSCDHAYALVGFKTSKGQKVNFRIASSFISIEQAELNLKEVEGKSLDAVADAAKARWNEVLGRIEVEDGNIDNLRTFYSCLYRAVLFPRDLSEINAAGERVHYSPHDGKIYPGPFYTDTGFWDTFRSLFPFLDLVYPEVGVEVQQGLVADWDESGFLPEWENPGHRGCMIGNNSASVVADAYMKGLKGYDAEKLWAAVTHGAHSVHSTISSTGRLGWEHYDSLGYVPCDVGIRENAARTLEYAYDDWCIYTFGKALGKSEEEIAPYAKAAMNYRNLFDPEYKLMVGRNSDGSFERPFSIYKWGGNFTEGNSLHYTWSVFHDPAGLIDLMGGDESFGAMMDSVFTIPPIFDDSYYGYPIHEIREMQTMNMGNYAHGNQPIQHFLYLYDWNGQPWKAQYHIREAMNKLYNANFDGYCGDEDNGQTSAWYVFSALGFYSVCPGSNEYALGTPLFQKVTVHMNGGDLVISAPGNSAENFYVNSLKLNGKVWDRNYIRHQDIAKGGKLVFEMSSEPNYKRGTSAEARPYSFSKEK